MPGLLLARRELRLYLWASHWTEAVTPLHKKPCQCMWEHEGSDCQARHSLWLRLFTILTLPIYFKITVCHAALSSILHEYESTENDIQLSCCWVYSWSAVIPPVITAWIHQLLTDFSTAWKTLLDFLKSSSLDADHSARKCNHETDQNQSFHLTKILATSIPSDTQSGHKAAGSNVGTHHPACLHCFPQELIETYPNS